jgi:hypothetical protein
MLDVRHEQFPEVDRRRRFGGGKPEEPDHPLESLQFRAANSASLCQVVFERSRVVLTQGSERVQGCGFLDFPG